MRLQVSVIGDDVKMSDCADNTLAIFEYDAVTCRFRTVVNGSFAALSGSVGSFVMSMYVLNKGIDSLMVRLNELGIIDADAGDRLMDHLRGGEHE